MKRIVGIFLGLLWAAVLSVGQEADPKIKLRQDADLGLVLIFPEKTSAKEYFQKHPCVSGGWQFKEETKTHWIGKLSYPTGNVPPAFPTADEPAFEVGPIKIAKQPGLAIDLKKWKGNLVLLAPDAGQRFGSKKSLEATFVLIAYSSVEKAEKTNFLFKNHAELLFKVVKK